MRLSAALWIGFAPLSAKANCEDLAQGYGDVIPNQSDTVLNVGQDFDAILERGFLSFAVYEDFAPYSWRDGFEEKGIDIEIAKRIAESFGVDAKFNFFAADENVDADLRNQIWRGPLVNGAVSNIMMHVPYSKDLQCRNELVVLGAQYFNEKLATAYRTRVFPDEPPTTPYFRFHKVGVETHTISDFYLSNFGSGMLLPNVVHYPDHQAALEGLEAGEVDAVMGVKGMLDYYDRSDEIEVATPPLVNFALNEWTLGIAVRHNFREVYYEAEGVIDGLVESGEMNEIFTEFGVNWAMPDY